MQRVVNVEAKENLISNIMIWELDARCPRNHRPSHNTSSEVQTKNSKDSSRSKKTKPKNPKPTLLHDSMAESAKKEGKKKKKTQNIGGNVLANGKNSSWLLALKPRPQRKKSGPDALIVIK